MKDVNYSIIIPHHNIPKLLLRCLDSIPKRNDIQIIIVDDNSDTSIVNFKHFPGLKQENVEVYFTKEGKGAGYARNIGLKYAKGKWILFADADDFFSDQLDSILSDYVNYDSDLLFFNTKRVLSKNTKKAISQEKEKVAIWENYYKTHNIIPYKFLYTQPWGKIISRELIEKHKIRFDESIVANDYLFSLKTSCLATKIMVIDRLLYIYTLRENSLSYNKSGDSIEKLVARLDVYIEVQKYIKSIGIELKPMPIRSVMIAILKKNPFLFFQKLIEIRKNRISIRKLFMAFFIRNRIEISSILTYNNSKE